MTPRIKRFASALRDKRPVEGAVLDFGCGTGEITCSLAALGWQMTGCDASTAMIKRARQAGDGTIRWENLEGDSDHGLPFADAAFDGVISSSVFEYLTDPLGTAREIARVLKPAGTFLLTVPDPRHPIRRTEAHKIPWARSEVLWRLVRHTRWGSEFAYLRLSVNRWPPDAWVRLLGDAGFTVDDPGPCTDPLLLLSASKAPSPSP